MEINVFNDIAVIEVDSNLDAGALDSLRNAVETLLKDGILYFVLDLSKVKKATSVGASLLVSVYNAALKSGRYLKLTEVTPSVHKILEVSKLEEVFEICDTAKNAVESFKSQAKKDRKYIRKYRRIDCELKVVCHPKKHMWSIFDGWQSFKAKTKNICQGGAYICCETTFPKGTVVDLEIFIGKKEIKASAMVCWKAVENRHLSHYPGMGMKFLRISTENRKLLMEHIHDD